MHWLQRRLDFDSTVVRLWFDNCRPTAQTATAAVPAATDDGNMFISNSPMQVGTTVKNLITITQLK